MEEQRGGRKRTFATLTSPKRAMVADGLRCRGVATEKEHTDGEKQREGAEKAAEHKEVCGEKVVVWTKVEENGR